MSSHGWKHTARFFLCAFWQDLASAMFIVALPYLAMSLGGESMELGVLGAARGLAYMVACVLAAVLSDRTSRLLCIRIGVVGLCAAYFLTGAATQLGHLYGTAVLWAVALSFFWPSLFGWLGDTHPHHSLGRATGSVNLGWSIGLMIGGVLAGWLFEIAPELPFLVAVIPCLLARLAVPREGDGEEEPEPDTEPSPPPDPPPAGAKRRLVAAWLGNTSTCCLIGLMGGVFPRLGAEIGVTSSRFGLLMAVLGLMRIGVFGAGFLGAALSRDWRVSALVQVAAAAMVATVSAATSHLWLGVVFAVVGMSVGVAYSASLYASLAEEGARGLKSAIHEAALLAGVLVGTMGGGYVADVLGLRAPYVPVAAVALALVAVQIALQLSGRTAARGGGAGR